MTSDSGSTDDAPELEEPVISAATRRQLQNCYERGTKLSEGDRIDYDYANTMFTQCVVNDPGNLVYIEAFLGNLNRKYGETRKGAKIKGFGTRGPFKKAVSKKNWREALRLGPELLASDPWDVPTLRSMAEACAAYGYNEAELRYLRNALDANPKDVDVNKHCGMSLARMGQFDQAIACFHRIEEINPKDLDATKMVGLLTEDKARIAAGRPPKTVRPIARKKRKGDETEKPKTAAQESAADDEADVVRESDVQKKPRGIERTPRQLLERAIVDRPTDIDLYLQLADLLQAEQRYGDVERVLTKALAVSGNDFKVQARFEDAQIARLTQQLAIAEKRADVEKTEQAVSLADRMRQELNRREIEIYARRVARYPEDHQLQYELGVRLKRDGNYAEAAKYLMTAREDRSIKAQATLEIGECLQHQKKFNNALQFYARAADVAEDEIEIKKRALYRAGTLAAGLKEFDKAEEFFRQLQRIDADYKDLSSRLDKIKKIRDKG